MERMLFDLILGIVLIGLIVFLVGVKVFSLSVGKKVDKAVHKTMDEIKEEDNH